MVTAVLRCLACVALLLLPAAAFAEPLLVHTPPAQAPADKALELDFAVTETAAMASATVVWRPLADGGWRRADVQLSSTGVWRATIAAEAMDDPGVAYYVIATDRDGNEVPQFASAAAPHPVYVRASAQRGRELVALQELGGLRSDLRVSGEWVDYDVIGGQAGTALDSGPRYVDGRVSYRYWVLKGVEYIEAGVALLRGTAAGTNLVSNARGTVAPALQPTRVGFDRGWAEVGFAPHQYFGVGARLVLGADEETFRLGAAAVMRVGMPRRTRLQFEAGAIAGVGYKVLTGFHLVTIPRVPLALEIVLTNEPNAGQDSGERARLRVGYELTKAVTATLLTSYQALKGAEHGLGAGVEMGFRF